MALAVAMVVVVVMHQDEWRLSKQWQPRKSIPLNARIWAKSMYGPKIKRHKPNRTQNKNLEKDTKDIAHWLRIKYWMHARIYQHLPQNFIKLQDKINDVKNNWDHVVIVVVLIAVAYSLFCYFNIITRLWVEVCVVCTVHGRGRTCTCTGIQMLWKCIKTFTVHTYIRSEKDMASEIIWGCFVVIAIGRGVVVGFYFLSESTSYINLK